MRQLVKWESTKGMKSAISPNLGGASLAICPFTFFMKNKFLHSFGGKCTFLILFIALSRSMFFFYFSFFAISPHIVHLAVTLVSPYFCSWQEVSLVVPYQTERTALSWQGCLRQWAAGQQERKNYSLQHNNYKLICYMEMTW